MACKTLLISTALMLLPFFAEAQVTVGHNVRQEIHVSSDTGSSTATLSVTQAQTVLPNGKVVDGSIIALFDPSTRLFWWGHQWSVGASDPKKILKEYLDRYTFSVQLDQIICLIAQGRTLDVRTSEMRVSNMDEGVAKAIKVLPEQLSGFMSGKTLEFQQVPLADAVGQTFLSPKDFGHPALQLKIGAIERSASGLRIEIRNDRGESKGVILSSDFREAASDP